MLAALLANLSGTPPAPPVVQQRFFGGGPFTRRYGYDPRYYRQEDDKYQEARSVRDELPAEKAVVVEKAISNAVQAIRLEQPKPLVVDAKRIYAKVIREARAELGLARIERGRIEEFWRAEIARRVREQEEEAIAVLLTI